MKGNCYYCERPFGIVNGKIIIRTKDHIIPKIQGGINSIKNYVLCCKRCNMLKGGKTPDQFAIRLQIMLLLPAPPVSKDTLRIILSNTHELILKIAPYRDQLIKKAAEPKKASETTPKSPTRPSTPLLWKGLKE